MDEATNLDRLIVFERKQLAFYWRFFLAITIIAVSLFLFIVVKGWAQNLGTLIGSLLPLLVSAFPLSQVSKRKDHIEALSFLKEILKNLDSHDERVKEVHSTLMIRVQKMLEG